MRKILAAVFVSLDGVMQAPGGPDEDRESGFRFGGWTFPFFDETAGKSMDELFSEPYDLLLGRKTYDIFAGYWPKHDGNPIGAQFNAVTKYVATHQPESLAWNNSQWLGEDTAEGLRKLKDENGPTLLIQGSSVLIQYLLAHDLIDEFRVMIMPVVLGSGKRLFENGAAPGSLTLLSSQSTPLGVIVARYERAGEVKTGSFGD